MSTPRRPGQLTWPSVALHAGIAAWGWAQLWTFAFMGDQHFWLWYPTGRSFGILLAGVGTVRLALWSRLKREYKIVSTAEADVQTARHLVARAAQVVRTPIPVVVVLNQKQAKVLAKRLFKTGSIEISSGALLCANEQQMHALITRELVAYQRADSRKFQASTTFTWPLTGFWGQVPLDSVFGAPFDWPPLLALSAGIVGVKRLRNGWMRRIQAETDTVAVDLLKDGEALASGLEALYQRNQTVAPWTKKFQRFLLAQNHFVQRLHASVWQWDVPIHERAQKIRERGHTFGEAA